MAYLVEVPVDGGGRLVVEAGPSLLPSGLELASARPGEIIARARESLDQPVAVEFPLLAGVGTCTARSCGGCPAAEGRSQ